MSRRLVQVFVFLCLLSNPLSLWAYNFLYIHPTSGEPITWEQGTTIEYYLDPGPLGRLTNDQAHTLLQEAMKIWEEASPYADVPHFEFAGYLPEDVTGENYEDYVSLFQCYTDEIDSCASQAQRDLKTVIVFDEDSSILNNELCRITSCAASAGAKVFSGSSADPGNIVQGIAVLSDSIMIASPVGTTTEAERMAAAVGTMVHELGHLLGLAHSAVNQEIYINNSQDDYLYLPTMLSDTFNENQVALNPDDIAGISVLYPSADMGANTATIKGEILKADLTPMMHVNVIARNIEDPLCEAYSWLSGRFCRHSVNVPSRCNNENGETVEDSSLSLSGLPPGSYTLEVEEVADDNLALTLAPGLVDPFISGDAEFWNENDQADEENTLSSLITLSAGEIRENIDIILNRSEVTDDRIQYIPLSSFDAGPATRCQPSTVNYAELIGVEEETETVSAASGCSLIR